MVGPSPYSISPVLILSGMEVDGPSLHNASSGSNNATDKIRPLRQLADRVAREVELFAEQLDAYKPDIQSEDPKEKQDDILGLVGSYQSIAEDAIRRLQRSYHDDVRRLVEDRYSGKPKDQQYYPPDSSPNIGARDLLRWQEEHNTWALAHELLQAEFGGLDPQALAEETDRFAADGQYWADFLKSSTSAQERLIVMRWLEMSAETTGNDLDIIEQQLDDRTKRTTYSGWEDTRERIKAEKRLRLWDVPIDSNAAQAPKIRNSEGTANLVTQLDPDAPKRQNLALEKDDMQFERSFWTMIWEMLRRGYSMVKIRDWCADRGQQARALSIGAHADEVAQVPARRYLWRQACQGLARAGGLSDMERAVYGLISGDDHTTLPMSSGWNDSLYFLYNFKLLRQYESYMLEAHPELFPRVSKTNIRRPLTSVTGSEHLPEARKTIEYLNANEKSKIAKHERQKHIQGALISHQMVEFIFKQGVSVSRASSKKSTDPHWRLVSADASEAFPHEALPSDRQVLDDPDMMRVLAHLYLICQDLGYDFGEDARLDACENVLASYLQYLLDNKKFNMMPTYAKRLSEERCIDVLAKTCKLIGDDDSRQEFVLLLDRAGINVVDVLREHVDLSIEDSPYTFSLEDDTSTAAHIELMMPEPDHKWPYQRVKQFDETSQALTEQEETIIQAVRYFNLVEGAWANTFSTLTEVCINFLKAGRIMAAGAVVSAMPCSRISEAKSAEHIGRAIDIMEDYEGSDDEMTPELRRSSRRRQRSRSSSRPGRRLLTPDKSRIRRDLMKAHAKTYYELEQLVAALDALNNCAFRENEVVECSASKNPVKRQSNVGAKQAHRDGIDDLVNVMEPLLHNFLQSPPPYILATTLDALRIQYLPEMVIAYAACLHCAGYIQSREHLLQCLDLATNVADNERLIADFKAAPSPRYERRGHIVGEYDDGKAIAEREAHERAAAANKSGNAKASSLKRRSVSATPGQSEGGGIEIGDDGNGKGRMKELVDGMASASKALLVINAMPRNKAQAKRGRHGRTTGIWDLPAAKAG